MMKALLWLAAVRDTKQAGELRGDTVQFIASSSALVLMTQNGNIYRPLAPEQNRHQKVFHWGLHACAGGLEILKIYF